MSRLSWGVVVAPFLALAAAGVGGPGAGQDSTDQFVRIGAWNIEHLGNPGSRANPNSGVAQAADDLAEYITAAGVDVLALSEISDDPPADLKSKALEATFDAVKAKTGQTWTHALLPKSDAAAKNQLTGVAWNTAKAAQVGATLKIGVPNQVAVPGAPKDVSIWDRHPHAVKLSFGEGKTDVVFIPVHMKANTGGSPPPRVRRELEAQALMQELTKVRAATKDFDVVILGDTNILKSDEKAALAFKAFGFRDLNDVDETTHVGGAPFDRFYVPSDQPEFAGAVQTVFDTEFTGPPRNLSKAQFRKRYSDHYMVVTRVRVLPDDDN